MWGFLEKRLDAPIRAHLSKVYSSVASATFFAAGGALVHYIGILKGGWLTTIFAIIMLAAILASNSGRKGKHNAIRFKFLNLFAFFFGITMGPSIQLAWNINQLIVIQALLYTCVIFACFSLSAITAPEGTYLWLGAPLLSLFLVMFLASIINYYLQSATLSLIQVVGGPLLESAFILYDTQLIIAKFRLGERDYVLHALIMFVDLVSLFKDLLLLFVSKEKRKGDK